MRVVNSVVSVEGDFKQATLEAGSYAFEATIARYGGHDYFKLSKMLKWSQDGKYHPHKTVSIELSDFRDKVFPMIAEMLGKEVS